MSVVETLRRNGFSNKESNPTILERVYNFGDLDVPEVLQTGFKWGSIEVQYCELGGELTMTRDGRTEEISLFELLPELEQELEVR